jgi:hypothetical protein
MIWAVLLGFILAAGGAPAPIAVGALVAGVAMKGLAEIALPRSPLTGAESPYLLYVRQLRETGDAPAVPWFGYLLQMVAFGTILGMAAYGAWRLIQ